MISPCGSTICSTRTVPDSDGFTCKFLKGLYPVSIVDKGFIKFLLSFMLLLLAACEVRVAPEPELTTIANQTDKNALVWQARLRGQNPILPTDPKTADAFLTQLAEESDAILEHIGSHKYANPAKKLRDMETVDQMLRRLWTPLHSGEHFETPADIGLSELIRKVDGSNTMEIKAMLKGRGWFRDDKDGERAATRAWVIVQHADQDPEFQKEALALMEKELGAPGVSRRNFAYLYDRVQLRLNDFENVHKRQQRYGTQGRCVDQGGWEPFPLEDPDNVDARRAEMGLGTLSDYQARFETRCAAKQ